MNFVLKFQHVKRTGWVICDIEDCESIAGHMYRMGLMTFLLTEENNPTKLDRFRCLQIGKLIFCSVDLISCQYIFQHLIMALGNIYLRTTGEQFLGLTD